MNHLELGRYGEELAANHLVKLGYQILRRNYKWGRGELDIICLDKQELVIVEVKTRNSRILGEPYCSVTKSKQRQIIKVTNHYIQEEAMDKEVRFDIVSLVLNQKEKRVEHIKNAFYPLV